MATDPILRLSGLGKVFDTGGVGLAGISLDVAEGEFVSLLGPSGCGKTTTLRLIAGFERPSSGTVTLAGRDVTGLGPQDRPVNTVFQDYALFPHMNVRDNVRFGLSLRRMPRAEQDRRTEAALGLVGLADRIGARVQALSGGQRQRVALARAIVCEPRVLLLDEPLSALDAHLREQMQVELKRLQRELGTTFILVTHDQTEALSISDRIVVMNRGAIEQVASPAELYDRPATRFVAGFIGAMNLIPAEPGPAGLTAAGMPIPLPAPQGPVLAAIRPEDLVLTGPRPGAVPVRLDSAVFLGRSMRLHLVTARGTRLMADAPRDAVTTSGDLFVALRPGTVPVLLPGE